MLETDASCLWRILHVKVPCPGLVEALSTRQRVTKGQPSSRMSKNYRIRPECGQSALLPCRWPQEDCPDDCWWAGLAQNWCPQDHQGWPQAVKGRAQTDSKAAVWWAKGVQEETVPWQPWCPIQWWHLAEQSHHWRWILGQCEGGGDQTSEPAVDPQRKLWPPAYESKETARQEEGHANSLLGWVRSSPGQLPAQGWNGQFRALHAAAWSPQGKHLMPPATSLAKRSHFRWPKAKEVCHSPQQCLIAHCQHLHRFLSSYSTSATPSLLPGLGTLWLLFISLTQSWAGPNADLDDPTAAAGYQPGFAQHSRGTLPWSNHAVACPVDEMRGSSWSLLWGETFACGPGAVWTGVQFWWGGLVFRRGGHRRGMSLKSMDFVLFWTFMEFWNCFLLHFAWIWPVWRLVVFFGSRRQGVQILVSIGVIIFRTESDFNGTSLVTTDTVCVSFSKNDFGQQLRFRILLLEKGKQMPELLLRNKLSFFGWFGSLDLLCDVTAQQYSWPCNRKDNQRTHTSPFSPNLTSIATESCTAHA